MIIQSSDGVDYSLTLTSPVKSSDDAASSIPLSGWPPNVFQDDRQRPAPAIARGIDPSARSAVRGRPALVKMTPSRLHSVLLNEQWLRIIKNGKDIGYSDITEDVAGGIPPPPTQKQMEAGKREIDLAKALSGDGAFIGVRMR